MKLSRQSALFLAAVGLIATPIQAQNVISAKSGIIHETLGEVYMDDKLIERKWSEFPEIKKGAVVSTELGRAEILLTPGVFVRMGENSSFRMVSNSLSDTRIELLTGSILVECAELLKDNAVTFLHKGFEVTPPKAALFRIDADPASVRVYDGVAEVVGAGQQLTLKEGRATSLGVLLAAEKFNNKEGDALYRWTKRRASYIAAANLSAAKSLRDNGYGITQSGWFYNPYFGLCTFIPGHGYYSSPFGYRYWSPRGVYQVYQRPVVTPAYSGGWGQSASPGYSTVTRSVSSSPAMSSPSSPAPSVSSGGMSSPRGSDSSVGRGGDSGGGRGR